MSNLTNQIHFDFLFSFYLDLHPNHLQTSPTLYHYYLSWYPLYEHLYWTNLYYLYSFYHVMLLAFISHYLFVQAFLRLLFELGWIPLIVSIISIPVLGYASPSFKSSYPFLSNSANSIQSARRGYLASLNQVIDWDLYWHFFHLFRLSSTV